MKVLRASDDRLVFQLGKMEQEVFVDVLGLYPRVPAGHQRLSQSAEDRKTAEDQQLLDAALAEQRQAHKRRIQTWLGGKNRFRPVKSGYSFTLLREDADWLLQVLNDIRIGSWLQLGSPEEAPEPETLDSQLHPAWAAMEISGHFQMALLHALESSPPD